jgi:hypothetical protein
MLDNKRKYARLKTAQCPACGGVGVLKKIMYGMPSADFDFEKYIVGGCFVTGQDPEIGCVECGWEGMRGELIKD